MFPVALSPHRNQWMSQDTEDGETSSYGEWGHQMRCPGGHLPSCEVTYGSATAWKCNTCPESDHFDVFKEYSTGSKEDLSETVQSIFICVFVCQSLNGAQIFQTFVHLNLMHCRAEWNTHALLNVHPNVISHTTELKKHRRRICASTTSRWVVTSAALNGNKSNPKQLLCRSAMLWLRWKRVSKVNHDSSGPWVLCFELTHNIKTTSMTQTSSRD